MRFLKIEWRNTTDLGSILYQDGFTNRLFLDVEVDEPEYPVNIESDQNGDNVEVPRWKKWQKAYHFKVFCTEDLVDAFTAMQIHDTITVTLQTGQIINVESLRASVEWQEYGCLALVDVLLLEDYIIGTNCDENMDTGCLCSDSQQFDGFLDIAVKATTSGIAGDIVFFYTAEDVPNVVYRGSLWRLTTTGAYDWVEITSEQYDCWEETTLGLGKFVFHGTWWILFPGAIAAVTLVAGLTYRVTTWGLVPGAFAEILYSGAASGSGGIHLTSDFPGWGVEFTFPMAGNYDVELRIFNNGCNFGNTDKFNINV